MEKEIKKIMLDWNENLFIEPGDYVDKFSNSNIEIEYCIPKEVLKEIWEKAQKELKEDYKCRLQDLISNTKGCDEFHKLINLIFNDNYKIKKNG